MVCFELHNKKANHKTKRLCRNYQKRVLSILVMTKTEDPRFWYFQRTDYPESPRCQIHGPGRTTPDLT